MHDQLSLVFAGHVDHGKSTVIGRLLYETESLPAEKLAEIEAASESLGRAREFAFAIDSLEEERRQGITIDTAHIYFSTETRDYIVIDAPGHREFIRNMVTGASQAEAGVLIVDATQGVREQTRRHAVFMSLLGLRQIVVVVNKMDLIDYAREPFERLRNDIAELMTPLGAPPTAVLPISAQEGDNVTRKPESMPWYEGPTLIQALESLTPRPSAVEGPVRFPVQDVYKVGDRRILAGRVERGRMRLGQELVFLPGGEKATVNAIEIFGQQPLNEAEAGRSIGITLDDPLFVERGHVGCDPADAPEPTATLEAKLFWMVSEPLNKDDRLVLRCATQQTDVTVEAIRHRVDTSALDETAAEADRLERYDVGEIILRTREPIVVEPHEAGTDLGRFVLSRGDDVLAGGIVLTR